MVRYWSFIIRQAIPIRHDNDFNGWGVFEARSNSSVNVRHVHPKHSANVHVIHVWVLHGDCVCSRQRCPLGLPEENLTQFSHHTLQSLVLYLQFFALLGGHAQPRFFPPALSVCLSGLSRFLFFSPPNELCLFSGFLLLRCPLAEAWNSAISEHAHQLYFFSLLSSCRAWLKNAIIFHCLIIFKISPLNHQAQCVRWNINLRHKSFFQGANWRIPPDLGHVTCHAERLHWRHEPDLYVIEWLSTNLTYVLKRFGHLFRLCLARRGIDDRQQQANLIPLQMA
mmetsp:Transcript_20851/g.39773  ORF Transcript_20851/g.39773 Transcript_20851/m.39773 type:complete len:281 (+) Transcript_20851:841-1683(+)